MINTLIKRIVIIGLVICIIGFTILKILFHIGINNGVEVVDLPSKSKISALNENADYADAYKISLSEPIKSDLVNAFAAGLGKEYFKNDNEIVVKGTAPGLTFFASFYMDSDTSLTLSTVVFYDNLLGLLYFTPVKIVHQNGLPYFIYKEFGKQ